LTPISPTAHITFCTLAELVRPQIFSTFFSVENSWRAS
jgi:hypothetical protein